MLATYCDHMVCEIEEAEVGEPVEMASCITPAANNVLSQASTEKNSMRLIRALVHRGHTCGLKYRTRFFCRDEVHKKFEVA